MLVEIMKRLESQRKMESEIERMGDVEKKKKEQSNRNRKSV